MSRTFFTPEINRHSASTLKKQTHQPAQPIFQWNIPEKTNNPRGQKKPPHTLSNAPVSLGVRVGYTPLLTGVKLFLAHSRRKVVLLGRPLTQDAVIIACSAFDFHCRPPHTRHLDDRRTAEWVNICPPEDGLRGSL